MILITNLGPILLITVATQVDWDRGSQASIFAPTVNSFLGGSVAYKTSLFAIRLREGHSGIMARIGSKTRLDDSYKAFYFLNTSTNDRNSTM